MKLVFRVLLGAGCCCSISLVAGCWGSSQPEVPYGPCAFNDDCHEGERCRQGWCEDIYKPKREIGVR